ncbi:hypothetical protein [Brevundimonas poindexterae]|uniref:hypothetical protein n=1 Tax=Brevundimonas poindexterae TaxID=74325 RepID=UPI001CFECEFF|nr:hypothetical protein [Brevundimonas poindexterae]
MRLTLALAAALAIPALMPDAAQAQERPPAYTNAEACLRDRAADAVAAGSGAADAANFLLNYLCAEQVSYATAYENNSLIMTAFDGMSSLIASEEEEQFAHADETYVAVDLSGAPVQEEAGHIDEFSINPFENMYVDPVTGEMKTSDPDMAMSTMMPVMSQFMGSQMGGLNGQPPLFLRVFAGELVLQQRR